MSVAVTVAGSVVKCPAIRRVDSGVVAVSVVGRLVVAISGAIVSVVTVWNASRQARHQSNDYRQVFEHRRLRSAIVTRRIKLPTSIVAPINAAIATERAKGAVVAIGWVKDDMVIPFLDFWPTIVIAVHFL